ncbi:hypothetical protein QNI16_36010 [Cytophagaceae bacterium YF14B1]|uniref:Uncharacterized protein n=1 Tax=Xanthocytophaga flava TaxID=3048013 RepID=A0AAE3UBM8_9BACT|nr:hypothetical protein [Xanthocytophaga flavus]MDJ1485942.1 hypothetical protein [Xanthocytophaga flavus]
MIYYSLFAQLPLNEKAELTWQKGTFLTCQMLESHSLSLYALGDFYVELVYDPENNRIVDLTAFKDTSGLAPYLDKIKIG